MPDLARMPFHMIVGQDELKRALVLNHIDPQLGGVLISGERGTGKSSLVRAFTSMVEGRMPVTLPINATEDRVIGGWSKASGPNGPTRLPGLLEEAHGSVLYVDEVNLLTDRIVNLILDAAASGYLVVEREGIAHRAEARFTLVGTMNPEEGPLRPQLLDRFGMMVKPSKPSIEDRRAIIRQVLELEQPAALERAREKGVAYRAAVEAARARVRSVRWSSAVLDAATQLAHDFLVDGHRAEVAMAFASRAQAALLGDAEVAVGHLEKVAPLILCHRRKDRSGMEWTKSDDEYLRTVLGIARPSVRAPAY